MRRCYRYAISAIFAGFLFLGSIGQVLAAGNNDDPRCVGLKGAAFGMCNAAIAAGCDVDLANLGCQAIVDTFIQITGENPPWSKLPDCPCGSADLFIKMLYEYAKAKELSCHEVFGYYLAIDTVKNVNEIFSFYPGQGLGNKQTCGFYNTSYYVLSDEEAQSCINELNKTADYFGLVCKSTK